MQICTKALSKLVEIEPLDRSQFLKVKETLNRLGLKNETNKTFYPSCVVYHFEGRYYIAHFKEIFALRGQETSITDDDLDRRDRIVELLEEWNLVKPLFPAPKVGEVELAILRFNERDQYRICPKVTLGHKKG